MTARKSSKAAGRKKQRARSSSAKSASAFRLPPDVRPTSMDIQVDVDPSVSDRYRGEVGINLQLGRRMSSIELHARDIRLGRARIRFAGQELRGKVIPHTDRETAEIRFDAKLPAGHARLEIAYSGRLRRDLCGLYGAKVGTREFAFSQLAATHARRFFPCFDEPAMKTRYRLSVTTGVRNVALSNSPIESEELHAKGRKTIHFAATPLLSSYLVALAVGELEGSEVTLCGNTKIRVWCVPGKQHLAEFALNAARECLQRLEAYFDLPYPYEKLDLVAVPDFEFGAMENAGAVFFRETLLLLDPESATLVEKKRAAEVICHELAHMWYGDLVTMAWWDDLWLNEAFATWMAFEILADWQPDWKIWQTFQHRRAAALDADELRSTHPIYTPVKNADEAMENFDLITYEKGASVIRMIEQYLGEEAFREGVQLYIRRHRESNTVAADLWNALSEASGSRVERIVKPWIEQDGHPLVSMRRTEKDGLAVVELAQQRLFLDPPPSAARRRGKASATAPTDLRWPIPVISRIGTGKPQDTREIRHLLTKKKELIPAHGADLTFIYGNANEGGFYRPAHGKDELRDLIEELHELEPIERQGLVDHEWALVRTGHAPLAGLLDLAAALGAEQDPDVLAMVRRPLHSLTKRLAPDISTNVESKLRAWVEVYYGGQVDALGWEPLPDEDESTRLRRAQILGIVGVVGESSSVVEQATRRCHDYLEDHGSLDPNLSDDVVTLAAMHGDAALWEKLLEAKRKASTPQEEQRLLLALGSFREPELIDRTLELCLGADVAIQDVVFLLTRLFENRHAAERTWAFVKRRWSKLRKQLPAQLGGRLIAATPALLTEAYRRDVAQFFEAHPLPASDRALHQALERFDWYLGFRERAAPQLETYLGG